MITAISPIDGRYSDKTKVLGDYFSEFALIKYRILVEIEYFIQLSESELDGIPSLNIGEKMQLRNIYKEFDTKSAEKVKSIEKVTNHDVKAVEYFIKEQLEGTHLSDKMEFIHFGLTSQDINNTAIPLSLKHALNEVIIPSIENLCEKILQRALEWKNIPMLARTHGQPASPTGMGKEIYIFAHRLHSQISQLKQQFHYGKFGGATGNFNAHIIAYPTTNWAQWADIFLSEKLGLTRYAHTTQIEHYDGLACILQNVNRIQNILIDLCRDIWMYISIDYFKQKTIAGEIGSSAMPHKVNPIDFENAEGNLGISIALNDHLANKLPISRWQRDLTDSTVIRNLGVPFAHLLIAISSIEKGLDKLVINREIIKNDLDKNWSVLAEAIQSILRKSGYAKPYEALKDLTRGRDVNKDSLMEFIDNLQVDESIKQQMRELTPETYTGSALLFDTYMK
jgi:adenylosuccinate lyase